MRKLEYMQAKFQDWLREQKQSDMRDQGDLNKRIKQKLIEIANENNYGLIYENASLGEERRYLFFQNQATLKFLAAKANEEGFFSEEQEDLW